MINITCKECGMRYKANSEEIPSGLTCTCTSTRFDITGRKMPVD